MEVKVNFIQDDLLSKDSFVETMIYAAFPRKKGELVATVLKKYMFIKEGSLYVLQKNFIYGVADRSDNDNIIWTNVARLLEDSFESFSKEEGSNIRERMAASKMSFSSIFSKNTIMKYIDPIKFDLVRDIELDAYAGQLHFRNGFIDIKTQAFEQRNDTHFITKYIDRDYKPSTAKQRTSLIQKYLKPIYPKQEDLDCIIGVFGSALTGKSTKEQDMMFLLGEGSSGKSTILLMLKEAITIYFQELKSDTFSTSNSERNKLANSYLDNKQVLITWINEMVSERIDAPFFKSFTEGNCTTTKLYKEGSFQFKHKSKVVATSNDFPNIQIDSGTRRRIRAYTHEAQFVDDVKLVDASKNIHLKDKDMIEDMITHQYLDAWIDILVEKASDYMNGKTLVYSDNFAETKDTVVSSNDYMQDFIDSKLIITDKPNDRIGKRTMHSKFHEMYPNRHLKELDIITSLKSRKIAYDKSVRNEDSIRGCFIGVKLKSDNLHKALDYDVEQSIDDAVHPSVLEMENEITRLKAEIAELKKNNTKKVEVKQTVEDRYAEILKDFHQIHKPSQKKLVKKVIKVVKPEKEISQNEIDDLYILF